ncbi:chemotaxis protein CheW [Cognatiyoonia sp. IB215182]|uniref:chemotaxis protein CheW n=1 Tax=Cognatiyoonia sp. IB215182 TaxID=3097353 RepID=UPI002A10AB89|nr:chemotaxis protein CheW [Cognatiyoonia sp. IB215182]MDX8351411.1 chemotaxis protein CheW [Cognatiyoonia sp. IB215182]
MSGTAQTSGVQFGVIQIGEALIAIPIQHLSEVLHVQKQEPLAQSGAFLRGGIALRGQIVPVLDLQALAGLPEPDAGTKLGVIVEYQARQIALFADRIIGIANIATDDIHKMSRTAGDKASLFTTLFAYDESFASVLDVSATFDTPDIFTAKRPDISKKNMLRTQVPMLTFEAGTARFSVPAVEVYAAIPRQSVESTAITMGPVLGEITYHGRRIPVVCASRILGLGDGEPQSRPEIVALRFPDDLVLGFAVDAIHEIGTFSGIRETTIPLWQSGRSFVDRVMIRDDELQIYVVDLEKLNQADDLLTIAKLSKIEDDPKIQPKPETTNERNVSQERQRYLVVDADARLAIPLSQVNRIVEPPDRVTPATVSSLGFRGYFSRFNESIALYDLATCRGGKSGTEAGGKVLLTGQTGHQVGFRVENVVSIEMSEWCEKPAHPNRRGSTTLVQLGDGEQTKVLPAFNLNEAIDEKLATAIQI